MRTLLTKAACGIVARRSATRAFPPLAASALCLVLAAYAGASVSAADAIYVSSASSARPQKITGTILDYSGDGLVLRPLSGLERTYPLETVVRLETDWPAEQLAGDEAFERADYRRAAAHYAAAIRQDTRTWLKRLLLARLVRCHRAVGETATACDLFLSLVSGDTYSPHLDCAPLAWMPTEAIPQATAAGWLARDDEPAVVLLGASYLLSTPQRSTAMDALRKLAAHDDQRIAAWAIAQSWRAELIHADEAKTRNWQAMSEEMPPAIRAGPHFLLGEALARLGDAEGAALHYLRVPILFPDEGELAAAALLGAGENLERIENRRDAVRLYQEVLRNYPKTRYATLAQSRLDKLNP